jgi:galactitol-specific phosphotransferase system IIC component
MEGLVIVDIEGMSTLVEMTWGSEVRGYCIVLCILFNLV